MPPPFPLKSPFFTENCFVASPSQKSAPSIVLSKLELFCLQSSFFAYSPLTCFLDALSHCKQKRSSTVSKKELQAKKLRFEAKALRHNCKQKSSAVSRKLPTVSKEVASLLSDDKNMHGEGISEAFICRWTEKKWIIATESGAFQNL